MRVCFSAVSGRAGFQTGNLMGHFPILGPAQLTERDDMISLQKHGWLVVVLAGAALAACVQGEQQRSEEHTSELQSLRHLVCRLLLEKKKKINTHSNGTQDRYS